MARVLLLLSFISLASAQWAFTVPDGNLPELSPGNDVRQGDSHNFIWQVAANRQPIIDGETVLDSRGHASLWITSGLDESWSRCLAADVDSTNGGSWRWTVDLSDSIIDARNGVFIYRIQRPVANLNVAYDWSTDLSISSVSFRILKRNADAPTTFVGAATTVQAQGPTVVVTQGPTTVVVEPERTAAPTTFTTERSANPTAPAVAATPSPNSSSSSSTVPNSSAASSSGLSTGAKAGIGIGAAIGVILLAILAVLFLRRRRRANAAPSPSMPGEEHASYAPPVPTKSKPAMTSTQSAVPGFAEAGHGLRAEMATREDVARYELGGRPVS